MIDNVDVAGGGDKNIAKFGGVIHVNHAVAFHCRLQRADRINFRYPDRSAHAAKGLRAALADIAIAENDTDFTGDHHIGGAFDAVEQGFAAAIKVIELALGDRVIDVHGREHQFTGFHHLIQPVHAGGGFLSDPLDAVDDFGPLIGTIANGATQHIENSRPLFIVVSFGFWNAAGFFVFRTLVHQQGGIAAIIENHVGLLTIRPG